MGAKGGVANGPSSSLPASWRLVALLVAVLAAVSMWVPGGRARLGPGLDDDEVPDEGTEWQAMAALVPSDSGYHLSEWFATTPDGYILRLFRLQYTGSNEAPKEQDEMEGGRPVVLIQHALMDSGALFLLRGPEKSLGFILAKEGFDVWLGNIRGNRFSRNHTHLNPDTDPDFWSFTWDEHAALDLPTMVTRVLEVSGAPSLQYIGYSQGTTMALAGLSSRRDLAALIDQALLLVPVWFAGRINSVPFVAMSHLQTAEWFQRFGVKEFAAHDPQFAHYTARLCSHIPGSCIRWMQVLCGANPDVNLDPDLLPTFMHYLPAGTSVMNMHHWSQALQRMDIGPHAVRMYDFGSACPPVRNGEGAGTAASPSSPGRVLGRGQPGRTCNQIEYGQPQPPAYNLSAITTPIALFTGGTDLLSDSKDVEFLIEALPPSVIASRFHDPEYGHLDYGVGVDAPERAYPHIVAALWRGHAQRRGWGPRSGDDKIHGVAVTAAASAS